MSSFLPLLLVQLAVAAPGDPVATVPPVAPAPVAPPSVRVGQAAPQFVLPALNSSVAQGLVARPEVALGDFVGIRPPHEARAVVVTFLRKDGGEGTLAALQRLHRKHGKSGVRVLAVLADTDDLASDSAWVEGMRLEYPVLRDGYRIATERYGVATWPLTLVINPDGSIEGIGVARENLEPELDAILTASASKK
jgi:peroxiredoxin